MGVEEAGRLTQKNRREGRPRDVVVTWRPEGWRSCERAHDCIHSKVGVTEGVCGGGMVRRCIGLVKCAEIRRGRGCIAIVEWDEVNHAVIGNAVVVLDELDAVVVCESRWSVCAVDRVVDDIRTIREVIDM